MINLLLTYFPSLTNFAAACDKSFFGFPTWYKYLDGADTCEPKLTQLNDVWLIALAVTEILLRLAILIAIAYVLIGGQKYITSRGNPDKMSSAKNTVTDGLTGVVIAIAAIAVVSYIAGRFN